MTPRYELRAVGVFDREAGVELRPVAPEYVHYLVWLAAGNRPAPMPEAAPLALEQVIACRVAEIEAKATEQRQRVTGPASAQEMASWAQKLAQAQNFKAAPLDASAPMLALEAQARGVMTSDIATRVLANADAFTRAEARIAGTAGRHRDAVRALATIEAAAAYDIGSGWPFMPPPPVPITGG